MPLLRVGGPVRIIANPLYDSVFKALMEDPETARGFLSILTDLTVVQLQLLAQEHAYRDAKTGEVRVFRLDFCATVETASGRRYQVLIELQKAKLGRNALRFRYYLGSRYQSVEDLVVDETVQKISLPILSIYLLGFVLDDSLPMGIRVRRRYEDAVTGAEIAAGRPSEFIEQLTHDALFIQIPKLGASRDSRLERVMDLFDQRRQLESDAHRLALEEDLRQTDPVVERMLRTLNRLQESPEMEQIMTLEDLYQLEQEQMSQELEAMRRALSKEKARLEEEQKRREEEQKRREEEQRRRQAQEEQLRMEQRRREEAEQELATLRKMLEDKQHGGF
jgi:DNA repair exonuclease SbcCD nuclease subunit